MENIEHLKKQFAKQKAERGMAVGFNYFVVIVGCLLMLVSGYEIFSMVGRVETALDGSITKPILIALWSIGFGIGMLTVCAAGVLTALYNVQENTQILAFLDQKEKGIELNSENQHAPEQSGM